MYAGNKKLSNLVAFTDKNGLQIDGTVDEVNSLGDLEAKYNSFGWYTQVVKDGHDVGQILEALKNAAAEKDRPSKIILNTVKGKGVDFMENNVNYHHAVLTEDEIKKAYAIFGIGGGK
jgi:transketolase